MPLSMFQMGLQNTEEPEGACSTGADIATKPSLSKKHAELIFQGATVTLLELKRRALSAPKNAPQRKL